MKKIKTFFPILAFLFAMGVFAAEHLAVVPPDSFYDITDIDQDNNFNECIDCIEPLDGERDPDGDVYRRIPRLLIATPGEYVCNTEIASELRRYCKYENDWSPRTGCNNLTLCIPLWKDFPVGAN